MKIACSISQMHVKAMAISSPGIGEWEIQADRVISQCAGVNSYNPIVGGGQLNNPHYSTNVRLLLGVSLYWLMLGVK